VQPARRGHRSGTLTGWRGVRGHVWCVAPPMLCVSAIPRGARRDWQHLDRGAAERTVPARTFLTEGRAALRGTLP